MESLVIRKIVEVSLFGYEPCPWSVPTVTRWGGSFYAKKSRPEKGILNLPDWQDKVRDAATKAMEGIPMQVGPVKVHSEFYVRTPKGRKHGELWTVPVKWSDEANKGEGGWVKVGARGKTEPDILNLSKGTEDALENVVYANDVQVRIRSEAGFFGPEAGVKVTVYAIDEEDFPGRGDPQK